MIRTATLARSRPARGAGRQFAFYVRGNRMEQRHEIAASHFRAKLAAARFFGVRPASLIEVRLRCVCGVAFRDGVCPACDWPAA